MLKSPQFFVKLTRHPQYAVFVNDLQLRRSAYSLYVVTRKPSLIQSDKMLGPVDTTNSQTP